MTFGDVHYVGTKLKLSPSLSGTDIGLEESKCPN
jgi:hypothetical protein